jgi:hypothetical protein
MTCHVMMSASHDCLLERQEPQDEQDGEDIYSDDLRGNFARPVLPIDPNRQ